MAHGEDIPPTNVRSRWIADYLEEYLRAKERSPTSLNNRTQAIPLANACWYPPPEDFWKLNTDAVWTVDPPLIGVGAICRDHQGAIMDIEAHNYDLNYEGPTAELKAFLIGINLAKSLGCVKLEVESNCEMAIFRNELNHGVVLRP